MSRTKTREPLQFAPLMDEPADNLPEPAALTPEQISARRKRRNRIGCAGLIGR